MFSSRYNRIGLPLFFIIDLLILLSISLLFSYNTNIELDYVSYLIILLCWTLPSLYFKSYNTPRVNSIISIVKSIGFTSLIFSLLISSIISLKFSSIGLLNHYLFFLFTIFFSQLLFSLLRYELVHRYRLKGKNYRKALVLSDNISKNKFNEIKKDGMHYGYKFISLFDPQTSQLDKLKLIIAEKGIDILFIDSKNKSLVDEIINFCDNNGIRIKLLLSFPGLAGKRIGLEQIASLPFIDIRNEPLLYLHNRIIKRVLDIAISTLSILFVLTWLPIIVKVMQLLTYPGPLFFTQERIGLNGKKFKLYKFRTMFNSSESTIASKGKSKITKELDERVSKFGKFLRKSNLDEYPQFINVFLGSMSSVGPRPHMVREDEVLENKIINYRIRRFIKPGITGWAAINGFRGGTNDINLMQSRTNYDIWYLENWSIWVDIKIIIITVWQMITFRIPKAY